MGRFHLGGSRPIMGLMDSDSDDLHFDQGSTILTDSEDENIAIAKPVKRASKTKAETERRKRIKMSPSPPPNKERKADKERYRGALRDKTNGRSRREMEQSEEDDTEDAREFDGRRDTVDETMLSMDELDASMISIQRPVKASSTKTKAAEKVAKPAAKTRRTREELIVDETTRPIKRELKARKEEKLVQKKRRRGEETEDEAVYEIPGTQVAVEEVLEQSIEEEVIAELEAEPTPKPVVVRRPSVVRKQEITTRQTSIQPRHATGGSFSDTEGGPANRRKIGDLQAKLDKMELKYRKLREVGIDAAEANYEKLRKQSEESAKAAKALIAQLKADSAAKDARLKELRNLQKVLDEKDAGIARQKEKSAKANAALADVQAENKALLTKLNAMKNAAANIESVNVAKIPGSAQKPGATRIMGSAETVKAHQDAQLKLSLYSDLTGLIVRSVKREEEEDVFDCIQTGKNGTLHFKLAVPNEKNASDDQAECHYIPMLDPSRDQALKELLPEYLWDEISFQAKYVEAFYGKVITAMTPRKCHECA